MIGIMNSENTSNSTRVIYFVRDEIEVGEAVRKMLSGLEIDLRFGKKLPRELYEGDVVRPGCVVLDARVDKTECASVEVKLAVSVRLELSIVQYRLEKKNSKWEIVEKKLRAFS